jgi:NADH:ubiquinone oxidoreductase subunit E
MGTAQGIGFDWMNGSNTETDSQLAFTIGKAFKTTLPGVFRNTHSVERSTSMKSGTYNGKDVPSVVRQAITHHGDSREGLVPVLAEVNRELGYLPAEAMAEISQQVRVAASQVLSVASFYHMLSTKPRGRHVIQFCDSAPCHLVGGAEVWQALQNELALEPGETSDDGKWTLLTTSCLGVCGVGPVVIIDDDLYGNVKPDQVPGILARYL